jgi:hypothetical protein
MPGGLKVPSFTTSGQCERCGKNIDSMSSCTSNGRDRLCERCFTTYHGEGTDR